MKVKCLGACVALLGLAMVIFAGMAYFELRAAATSKTPPSTDSMPLTKIVGPEFFAPGNAGTNPADLARKTINRIYTIAGGGIVAAMVGFLLLAFPRSLRQENCGSK